ncbi:MAG TPA: hypothetical protein VFL82_04970 [Thermomicrobiales bacterium]|nr:hypothetical protein [Thermomicrobiales bacterium]
MTDADQPVTAAPILAFAVSPDFSHDGIAFAAGAEGLLRTTDQGRTWKQILIDPASGEPLPTTAVAVAPSFGRDARVLVALPGGIGQSEDRGESWRFTALPLPPPLVSALTISPAFEEDGVAFASTMEDGMFRTDDHGESWFPWNFGLFDHAVLAVAISPRFSHDKTVYAGTTSGLYRSTNRGRSWQPLPSRIDCPTILSIAVATTSSGEAALFAGTEEHGLLRLDPNSAGAERIDDAALPSMVPAISCSCDLVGSRESLVVLGEDRVVQSTDGGVTWTPVRHLPVSAEDMTAVSPLVASGDGPVIFASTADGKIHCLALREVVA